MSMRTTVKRPRLVRLPHCLLYTSRATEQDLKKMLGVYFEQNVTTEKFEDFDGDRWVIVGD